MPKYNEITVQLVGMDGNAFSIMGRVLNALKTAGISQSEIDEFIKQATASNYDNLLMTVAEWVNIE